MTKPCHLNDSRFEYKLLGGFNEVKQRVSPFGDTGAAISGIFRKIKGIDTLNDYCVILEAIRYKYNELSPFRAAYSNFTSEKKIFMRRRIRFLDVWQKKKKSLRKKSFVLNYVYFERIN